MYKNNDKYIMLIKLINKPNKRSSKREVPKSIDKIYYL